MVPLTSAADRASLAEEQAALRRVATLVARGAPPNDVLDAIAVEVGDLIGGDLAVLARYDQGGGVTILASRTDDTAREPPSPTQAIDPQSLTAAVLRTGRPARVDDYAEASGPWAAQTRELGYRSAVGVPVTVQGRLWGVMVVTSTDPHAWPPDTEDRLAEFTELVATAIANAESSGELAASEARACELAEEQSALRRVATLVAEGATATDLFAAVAHEVAKVLGIATVTVDRYEPDGTSTVMAAWGDGGFPAGSRWPLDGTSVAGTVFATGRSVRIDDYSGLSGAIASVVQEGPFVAALGVPIVVEGALWGAICVGSSRVDEMPADTEARLAGFTELVATAIANSAARDALRRLADEQAALRGVATLVARAAESEQLFSIVASEVASVLNVPGVIVQRYEADGTVLTLGAAFDSDLPGAERFLGVGSRMPRDPGSLAAQVYDTHRTARIDDFSALPGTIGDLARAARLGSGCASPIVVNGELWGKMCVFSRTGIVLPVGTENRLHDFIELVATAIANHEARVDLAASEARARELAREQAALRRVATLVAEGATPNGVFDAVRDEVEQMFGIPNTILMRFDDGGTATLLATPGDYLGPVGRRWPLEGDDSAVARVYRSGRAARADYTTGAVGPLAQAARRGGTRFPVAVPVVVDGALWGAMSVGSRGPQPPPDVEGRLAKFTELLATAIANAESRGELAASEARARELAGQQAALRRVATLVAEGASPDALFSAVAEEVAGLIGIPVVGVYRYETDKTFTTLGLAGDRKLDVGTRWPVVEEGLAGMILATGRPARKDDYSTMPGPLGAALREDQIASAAGVPIMVDGSIWGFMAAICMRGESIPADTEQHLGRFTELVATGVSNATVRADLIASRARVVAAADETRRRLERDLHDGIQQWLVALALRARKAAALCASGESVVQDLSHLADDLVAVTDELREISRGIHPAILSDAGLDAALEALARRSAIRVDLDVDFQGRYDPTLEATLYYIAAESITNAVKHAQASLVTVRGGRRDGTVELEIRDDGVGGADPPRGTGLIGLKDRVDTLGGTIAFASPAGVGTTIHVQLPAGPPGPRPGEAVATPASG